MIEWFNRAFPNVVALGWHGPYGWEESILQTLYMTFFSAIFGGILGLAFGVALVVTADDGLKPHRVVFQVLDKVVSIMRAIPFIIMLALVAIPLLALHQTTIGMNFALWPLTLGVFPFYARQIQAALENVDSGTVEAAQTVGTGFWGIIFSVYLREELSTIIRVSTVTVISLIGLTAMAGAVGAGGLGNTAIARGYNNFQTDITIFATVLMIILILIVQLVGDLVARRVSHR